MTIRRRSCPNWVVYAVVFSIAWLVRLIYLIESSRHPAFHMPLVDAGEYFALAMALGEGTSPLPKLSWQPWFLPVVLSWVIQLAGPSLWPLKLFSITAGAFTCVAAAGIGHAVGQRRLAWVAGLLCAFYGPLIHYDGEFLAASWAALWLTATLWVASLSARSPHWRWCVLFGVLGALCWFTRPPLIPAWLVAGWVFLPRTGSVQDRVAQAVNRAGIIVVGWVLAALPFLAAIADATGTWRLLPDTGAVNLYIGNSADPCATINIRPGYAWDSLMVWPNLHGAYTAKDQQRFYMERMREDIRAHPGIFIKNLGAKTAQFFSSREIPRNVDLLTLRDDSWVLRATTWRWGLVGFPFGLAFGLALVGLVYRRPLHSWWMLSVLLAYAAGIIAVHVCDRYRLPVIPLILIFSASGVLGLWELIRSQARGTPLVAVGLLAGGVILTSVAGPFCSETLNYRAELYRLIATEAYQRNDLDLTERYARMAIQENSSEVQAINQLGLVHARRGEIATAEEHFNQVLEIDPTMPLAWFNLAKIHVQRGDLDQAARRYEQGLSLMPGHIQARMDAAAVYLRMSQPEQARSQYQALLAMNPHFAPAHHGLRALSAPLPAVR
jgi:4-amino-4-deoxy-L-arabinose transferase-like glycosyltransferase